MLINTARAKIIHVKHSAHQRAEIQLNISLTFDCILQAALCCYT